MSDVKIHPNEGLYRDSRDYIKLRDKYPQLKGVGIEFLTGHPRGNNYMSIYYTNDGIKMIDEQLGNYSGGTVWLEGREGDSPEKLAKLIKNFLCEIPEFREIFLVSENGCETSAQLIGNFPEIIERLSK